MLRVLVLSDVRKWDGFREAFDKVKPDVLVLAGDIVSDGLAFFWAPERYSRDFGDAVAKLDEHYEALLKTLLPKHLHDEIRKVNRNKSVYRSSISFFVGYPGVNELYSQFVADWYNLKNEYLRSPRFHNARKCMHVDKFYEAIKYAGERGTKVFVVKGDHDDDFPGDYDVEKINAIKNCEEISGKVVEYKNLRFLGLGFRETHYLRVLRPIIDSVHADIVLTHAEQRRLPLITKIKPKIIFRGHFGIGKYFVDGVPVVLTKFPECYAIIEIESMKVRKVITKIYCSESKKWQKCNLSCKYTPELVKANRKLWPWMKRWEELCPLILEDKRKIE